MLYIMMTENKKMEYECVVKYHKEKNTKSSYIIKIHQEYLTGLKVIIKNHLNKVIICC